MDLLESEETTQLLAEQKVKLSLDRIEQKLLNAYEETFVIKYGEPKQGEEAMEEDLDRYIDTPQKKRKPSEVVITDDSSHEEATYDVKAAERRLFDSVCRSEMSEREKLKVFTLQIQ